MVTYFTPLNHYLASEQKFANNLAVKKVFLIALLSEENLLIALLSKNLIAKDPSADLPEPSKFVKRRQLNCFTLLFDLSDVVQFNISSLTAVLNIIYLLLLGSKGH